MPDYYKILGLNKNASDAEIKKQYKKLAIKWHPDKNLNNPQAEEEFKKISEAYQILSDKNKRKQYDMGGFSMPSHYHDFTDANDIFSSIFGSSFFNDSNMFNHNSFFDNSDMFNHNSFFDNSDMFNHNSFFDNSDMFNHNSFFDNSDMFVNSGNMSNFSSTSRSETYINGQKIVTETKNINGVVTQIKTVNGQIVSRTEDGKEMIENKNN
ncbi:DnaJ domain [seawater metagenome]|uniref:DnaJ domain n=1 Tax=seawater metagenome TaxID=1561972 RepID=A0A5E8CGJ8_9ZZZZ